MSDEARRGERWQYWLDTDNDLLYVVRLDTRGSPRGASPDPIRREDADGRELAAAMGEASAAGWERPAEAPAERFRHLSRAEALAWGEGR